MDETKVETTRTEDEGILEYIEYNGRTFEIINHYSGNQTFTDIIKNAMRREAGIV